MEDMIDKNDILSFAHYKKGRPFTGSFKGMRYRIVMEKAADEDDTDKFRVDTWPEPNSVFRVDIIPNNKLYLVWCKKGMHK